MSLILFCLQSAFYAFLIWCLYKLIVVRFSRLNAIPGYSLYNPVLGNLLTVARMGCFERWETHANRFGPIYRWYSIMSQCFIAVSEPEAAKKVLSHNYVRGPLTGVEVFRKIVGDRSMLIIDGDLHKRHRSIVSPAFRLSNLRQLILVMEDCADRLRDHFDRMIETDPTSDGVTLRSLDVRKQLSHVTLLVIGLAGFGFDFDCVGKPNRLAATLNQLTGSQSAYGYWKMLPYSYYYPIPTVRAFWQALGAIHGVIAQMIDTKLRHVDRNKSPGAKSDLLELVLAHSRQQQQEAKNGQQSPTTVDTEPLSELELRDEVMTFIMAGHETSSLALTWTVAMLCRHVDWQERCRDEVRRTLVSKQRLDWETLQQLPVCRAVVNETLRLWPPVPLLSRRALVDDTLCGYEVPADTCVVVLVGQMHRSPDIWPNAKEFRPERFLDESHVPWDAFMPFGEGTHKCLGYQFATAEILIILATLLRNYKFELAVDWDQVEYQCFITLQPVTPILVNMTKL